MTDDGRVYRIDDVVKRVQVNRRVMVTYMNYPYLDQFYVSYMTSRLWRYRNFMVVALDQETYDMVPLNRELLGDAFRFVKENTMCKVLSVKGRVFGIEPPNFVELVVTKSEPGAKGDTATNVTKPAIVETGAEIKVPLFINEGDKIQIDTRTGEYLGRSKA